MTRAHAIHLDDDEPQFRDLLHSVDRTKRLRRERALRPGVNVLDHGIFLRRIKVRRPHDYAEDVGLAISAFRNPLSEGTSSETFRWHAYLKKPIDPEELKRLLTSLF